MTFSNFYTCTNLPHNLIKEKLTKLIQKNFAKEKRYFWLVMLIMLFLLVSKWSISHSGLIPKFVSHSAFFLILYMYVMGIDSIYRQVIGIPIGTNCAPLIADLFLFCYERHFMLSLDKNYQADVITAFN